MHPRNGYNLVSQLYIKFCIGSMETRSGTLGAAWAVASFGHGVFVPHFCLLDGLAIVILVSISWLVLKVGRLKPCKDFNEGKLVVW